MARNQNSDASSSKSSKTSDNDSDQSQWPHLNEDLLSSIMMQLGLVDYFAFRGVCKSWRSLASSKWNRFMSSQQPMSVSFSSNKAKKECYLHDFEGKTIKITLPRSSGRALVGSTCGYLILFNRTTRAFYLVNPITRHELHFPGYQFRVGKHLLNIRATLVFSPSMSRWVLVVAQLFSRVISFSLAGNRPTWDDIPMDFSIMDLHSFKGKVYTINSEGRLFEVRLNSSPGLTPLGMKNDTLVARLLLEFASSGENLYVVNWITQDVYATHKIDFDKMEWVPTGKTIEEYALFVSELKSSSVINPDTWIHHERFVYSNDADKSKFKGRWLTAKCWYFPHHCMNGNIRQ